MFQLVIRQARMRAIAFLFGVSIAAASLPAAAYQHEYSTVPADALATDDAMHTTAATLEPDNNVSTNSGGCGKKAPRIGDFTLSTHDGNKKTRQFSVLVPGDYSENAKYALVFVFHGAGGSAAQSYSWGLQNAPGAASSAIFVFPNGIQYGNYGIGWDDSKNGYDMPFFDNMVNAVEADYCINIKRVFAAGFSWGGDFVVALTCARGTTILAAAVNSTTDEYKTATDSKTYENSPCPSPTHPHVRFEHAKNGDAAYPAPLFATTSSLYRRFNVCSTSSKTVASSFTGMTCVAYNSCSKQFVECAFPSSIGHALPPNWAKDTWSFLSSFQ